MKRLVELEECLNSLKSEEFIYVPNPGNAGDAMIALATYQMFDRLGLRYSIGNENGIYADKTIIYGGGGNLISIYFNARDFLIRNAGVARKIVVLPHTIRAFPDMLRMLPSNSTIFCREVPSYEFVRRATNAEVVLSDDLAFALEIPVSTLNPRFRRNVKRFAITLPSRLTSSLDAFRTDSEKTSIPIPARNVDVSRVYATADMSKAGTHEAIYRLAKFLRRFKIINTNRLHVGILGALLGKQVHFHDNSYGKNRSVFEHSMEKAFPKVVWQGAF